MYYTKFFSTPSPKLANLKAAILFHENVASGQKFVNFSEYLIWRCSFVWIHESNKYQKNIN